ncbi:MAG TPA: RlmE family RNA methyltransferase [Chloroflexota bacterium]|nr:RlmE family RNA methyltransferase [Chloroflexota bacterium]
MSWRREQGRDRFFRQAKAQGYRARSAYKLLEIVEKFRVVRPGQVVLDLGAAPGSWSQVAYERVGPAGRVVAVDLQPIPHLPGVETLVGDVRAASTLAAIQQALRQRADVVLSDVAPAATGILVTDQARAIELATSALAVARATLRPGGAFVVKVFRGEDFDQFLGDVRRSFKKVNVAIPEATRAESREAYVVARGHVICTPSYPAR